MIFVYAVVVGLLIAADQFLKLWIVANFNLGDQMTLIPKVLSLTYLKNTGGAFSLLEGKMFFFMAITILALVAAVYFLFKNLQESKWLTFGITLFIAGTIGNFIDRMRLGYVVDMFQLDFINFPIFNVADMALVIGVGCIIIYFILDERAEKNGRKN